MQYGANESGIEYANDLPRYIRITDIDVNGKLKKTGKLSLPNNIAKNYKLQDGDLLFARSGATVGKTFLYKTEDGDATFAGYLIKFTPNKKIVIPEYIYYFTQSSSYNLWLNQIFVQSTIQNISAEKYNSLAIPVPCLEEQLLILKHVELKDNYFNEIISKILKEINLINEYRTSLITEVVTGKIDVRGIAVKEAIAPELDEEFELDEEMEMEDFPESEE